MGDWATWVVLGSLFVILFCIYSLSHQLERCVHLAVEIITTNQRKILQQLETLAASAQACAGPQIVVTVERRLEQRRQLAAEMDSSEDRRRVPGRRRDDYIPATAAC